MTTSSIPFLSYTGTGTIITYMYAVQEFGNDCLLYSLDGILRYGKVLNVPQADALLFALDGRDLIEEQNRQRSRMRNMERETL